LCPTIVKQANDTPVNQCEQGLADAIMRIAGQLDSQFNGASSRTEAIFSLPAEVAHTSNLAFELQVTCLGFSVHP